MTGKSTQSARRRKVSTQNGWEPPYDDFPLSYHPPSGRLYKKIRGKRFYFGYAKDWQAAIDKYEQEREARYAGLEPRPTGDGLTIRDTVMKFAHGGVSRDRAAARHNLPAHSHN